MFTNNYNRDKNQTNRNRISAKGSQTTRKEGFYDINIWSIEQIDKMEELTNFDYGDSQYAEATIAKDKILSMAASDARFKIQSIYSSLSDQNRTMDINKADIPTESELDDRIENCLDNSMEHKSAFESNMKKYFDQLKMKILKHSIKNTRDQECQSEEIYVHISEVNKMNDIFDTQKEESKAQISLYSYKKW